MHVHAPLWHTNTPIAAVCHEPLAGHRQSDHGPVVSSQHAAGCLGTTARPGRQTEPPGCCCYCPCRLVDTGVAAGCCGHGAPGAACGGCMEILLSCCCAYVPHSMAASAAGQGIASRLPATATRTTARLQRNRHCRTAEVNRPCLRRFAVCARPGGPEWHPPRQGRASDRTRIPIPPSTPADSGQLSKPKALPTG